MITKEATCKDCKKEFTARLVFGQWVKRCDDCKTPFVNAQYIAKKIAERERRSAEVDCGHNNPNAGGYCITCGRGRDHS